MPRPRTLNGRKERESNRVSESQRRRRTLNSDNNNNLASVTIEIPLIDSYKCALNDLVNNFSSHNCGLMDLICRHCNARHFSSEVTLRETTQFTLCCAKGKVALGHISQNDFFNQFFEGLSSGDPHIKRRSLNYFENIRSFNSAFAMVSSEAKVSDTVSHFHYHFKIHDVFYHRVGPMTAGSGRNPSYAQLYFYDVDTANNYRMGVQSNQSCDLNIMRELSLELDRINPFVRSFRTMKEQCQLVDNVEKEIQMVITVNRNSDLNRFNDATRTDVAVIFSTVDGEPPFNESMISFSKTNGTIKNISTLDSALDPMAYPLLFPNGDLGWHTNIDYDSANVIGSNANRPRVKVTMLEFISHRLAVRPEFSLLHNSHKLFLQWVVDAYVRIEGARLHYIRANQANLRSEYYNNLHDYLESNANAPVNEENVGRRVFLPSSFTGSPRNMYQNYLDAMSIVRQFGKPSLFVTMTCNPNWPEIVNSIGPNCKANFRPDITVRVFMSKLRELIDGIIKKKIFGTVIALIYTIEFQKRGLPHAHILITLANNDQIVGANNIDRVVSAEIPDINLNPKLHTLVMTHMMHGPCGALNPRNVCMRDGKCSKDFPKPFQTHTRESVNGYPLYKRNDTGVSVDVKGKSLDNRYVVPYNKYLLAKFNCHINVEVCTTIKSVKYIYKYVYKGYDSATITVGDDEQGNNNDRNVDEVNDFVNGRYVGSTEAVWRIFKYDMHFQSHTIVRLDVHLPHRQMVYFRLGQEQGALENVKQTKLLAFFELNCIDESARQFTYTEIPMHFTWVDGNKKWKKRLRGGDKIISRMFVVSPRDKELFHLRLLLLHVCGAQSFQDVRTYNGVVYDTFAEACHSRGIASNDNEWRECLNEAKQFNTPKQLRHLFSIICALNVPANVLALWDEFKTYLSEDFLRDYSDDISFNRALLEIEDILISHNVSCEALGLPIPILMQVVTDSNVVDPVQAQRDYSDMFEQANDEQRRIIENVIREVQYHDTGSNVFCLTAHAGCGKTFTQTAIIHRLHSLNLKCIATAFSGIASTLLLGGRTLHNAFKLPIPITETSVSSITPNSLYGRYVNSVDLVLIDEISMCPLLLLKVLDRLFKDLCTIPNNKHKLFGGKTILLCGDFRQILPVVPHGSRAVLIENCISSWIEFDSFHHVSLSQNMRALPHEIEFVEFLKKIGNGQARQYPEFGENVIEIPQRLIGNVSRIVEEVYGNISENILSDRILYSVILATTNEECSMINNDIINRIPGESKSYFSTDKVMCDNELEVNNYPIEFLNSLSVSGLPPHKLILKVNCVVLLIRNLNTKEALVNGTRMRIKCLHSNTIDCEILTGTSKGKRILIPRINLTYSGTILPFNFQRTQFPIIPAFGMTINKSQGQTFEKVGILLRQPVFTHGQLYVAASRVRSFDCLKFYIDEHRRQGHLANDERVFTQNIVYTEVLRN